MPHAKAYENYAKVAHRVSKNLARMEMLNEDDVVFRTMEALKQSGWTIISFAMTKQKGVDIIAERAGQRLYVEAKGITSADEDSPCYGKLFDATQRVISTAAALLKAAEMRCEFPDAMVAIALPDHVRMRTRIERIEGVLENSRVGVLWSHLDGTVSEWNLAALQS